MFDWDALSAISTTIGILVALFHPYYNEYRESKKIIEAIELEYENIIKRLLKIKNFKEVKLLKENTLPEYVYIEGLLRGLSHPIWDEYYTKVVVKKMEKEEVDKIRGIYYDLDISVINIFFDALENLRNLSKKEHKKRIYYENNLNLAIESLKNLIERI